MLQIRAKQIEAFESAEAVYFAPRMVQASEGSLSKVLWISE